MVMRTGATRSPDLRSGFSRATALPRDVATVASASPARAEYLGTVVTSRTDVRSRFRRPEEYPKELGDRQDPSLPLREAFLEGVCVGRGTPFATGTVVTRRPPVCSWFRRRGGGATAMGTVVTRRRDVRSRFTPFMVLTIWKSHSHMILPMQIQLSPLFGVHRG